MSTLKVRAMGTNAEGIELTGNVKSCEPQHVRITFPGGEVEVTRAVDGPNPDYWVHVALTHPDRDGWDEDAIMGRVCDARLDQVDKSSSEANVGDLNRKELYHLALRVRPQWPTKGKP